MGLGKTIQAVSLIMSDFPAKKPSLVLVPPVALMQWMTEIESYTDGTLKTLVVHGTNSKSKNLTVKEIKKYDVIIMSYNSLESVYRRQEKGFKRKAGLYKEKSVIHQTDFHRVILDEAHCIKTRTTMTAKACFALKVTYRWCLSGTPLQNRIGEFFSLIRFLNVRPFACYLCKGCPCSTLEWSMNDDNKCTSCGHGGMQHISVFNQELLNPIQKYGNRGKGASAFKKLRILTDRIMLRRLKKDHTDSMELPVKEINVERQFFGEEENDFANSIMTNGQRKFDTYVASGVLLNNYANIFGLIMQMRQVADHPDLILKKNSDGGQNILVCNICDEPAEDAIRSRCKHDFCRTCVKSYLNSTTDPNCPQCHIPLSIDLEQQEIEQDEVQVKKSSIINRIKMENWTSSSKIELLVHELHKLRSDNASHKSIIFSQFTTMLQLIEWRLRRAGITTVMLDGSMTPAQRQASINHFMTNVDVEVFLVSLKAGGVALNLTEASRVFIVDPWWNPAA
jgi:DNA repair protein RAD16